MVFNKIKAFIPIAILALAQSCATPEAPETDVKQETQAAERKTAAESNKKVIIFFGNSLSAGYGVEPEESFPALVQARIDSLGYPYRVVNAGVSGETTATGLNRVKWVVEKRDVDIFVLELGANDGLRGLPPAQTHENLVKIIETVRNLRPQAKILLAGMMVPPSMGEDYSKAYNPIFPQIAKEENVPLIPFLLQDVGGVDSLNQADGIHPNPAGNKIVLENVWQMLEPMLEQP